MIRIREGKFYKTRDGRKVGPMERASNGVNWTPNDGRHWYNDNGTRAFGDDDGTVIVDEWVDEPAVAEPKFKVGDRVKFVDDYGGPARGKEATVVKLNVWGDGKGVQVDQGGMYGVSTEHAHSLRLVAPATSGKEDADGEPRCACEDEPDAKLLVSISADTSALDAEIDRVLKRLRKLKRKARKLGISLEYSELRDAA